MCNSPHVVLISILECLNRFESLDSYWAIFSLQALTGHSNDSFLTHVSEAWAILNEVIPTAFMLAKCPDGRPD